jgi:hypothetical protein
MMSKRIVLPRTKYYTWTMITALQARGARAILKLGVRDLAELAQVSAPTVNNLELERKVHRASVLSIKLALERGGIEFLGQDGVRFKDPA